MFKVFSFAFVAFIASSASLVLAAGEQSGLQPGDHVPAYIVEKCAGNPDDGVEVGQSLCYRCKMGSRPVVAVFTRSTDANVASLLKHLDKVVIENAEQKAASFVNLLGEDADVLKGEAEKLIKKSGSKKIAVVVPKEYENGPADYKLNPDVDVTVLLFKNGQIEANHALSAKDLDGKAIAAIVSDAGKMFQ